MRYLKKLCAACLLTITLTLSASAGEMLGGVTAPPPPTQQATAQGDMPAGVAGDMGAGVTGDMSTGITVTDPATEALLNLLQSLLSLF